MTHHTSMTRRAIAPVFILSALMSATQASAVAAPDPSGDNIRLELSPRICTLAAEDKQCDTWVHARWQSPHEESLCLVIVDRPEVKRCWEHYSEGTYNIELVFSEDLIFQLKDLDLRRVLASEALRVIRAAVRYRHKRRQPWNLFD
jgi:Protein of unknown function (DUF3019)